MAAAFELSEAQLEHYRARGYVHLRGILAPKEVEQLATAADQLLENEDLLDDANLRVVLREVRGKTEVLQINEIHQLSAVFDAVRHHPRLISAVSSLLGQQASCFKAKIIYKPPGAKGAILHQDYAYWQTLPSQNLITAVVSIDDSRRDNGCMRMYPDWRRGLLATDEILCVRDRNVGGGEMVETEPGDVILFHCLVPHESDENGSDRRRRQLFISYSEAALGDLSELHQRHFMEYTRRHFITDEARRARSYFR